MIGTGFVVAMRVTGVVDASGPGQAPDWLILARWGPGGRWLSVAEATEVAHGHNGGPDDTAPPSLHPRATWFATLASETAAEGAIFLLARDPPEGFPLAGGFRPAEGFARLGAAAGGLRLTLLARGPGRTWHLRAGQRPWLGTCCDGA